MGITVKYFGCFCVYFFMVIFLVIYVYIVNGNYLCVYIVMGNYLCLFFNKMCKTDSIYFCCMRKSICFFFTSAQKRLIKYLSS